MCLKFAMFNFSEKLQNIIEIGFKNYGVIVQKSLSEKTIFGNKKFADTFLLFLRQTSYCPSLRAYEQLPFDL